VDTFLQLMETVAKEIQEYRHKEDKDYAREMLDEKCNFFTLLSA